MSFVPLKIANIKGSSYVLPESQSTFAAQRGRKRLKKTENKAVRNIREDPPQTVMRHTVFSSGNMCHYKQCVLCKQQKAVWTLRLRLQNIMGMCCVCASTTILKMPETQRTARMTVLHFPTCPPVEKVTRKLNPL